MNYLYRMTHIDNIPHILRNGITHRSDATANPQYVAIGNTELITKRMMESVTTEEGDVFSPGDYIPFYFYARMPMLYNIQHGYGVKRVSAEDIVYMVLKIEDVVKNAQEPFYFSDGHAVSRNLVKFYGRSSMDRIDQILDQDAIKNDDWGDDYYVGIRKQAEFFVKGPIKTECIEMLVCYNESAKTRLESLGVNIPIRVSRKAYY